MSDSASQSYVVRAEIHHVPGNPFTNGSALQSFADGALVVADGSIAMVGAWEEVRARFPEAEVLDARGAFLLPGFVDTHVHFPQVGVIGTMGLELLDWLERRTFPHEARLRDPQQAERTADRFIRQLVRNGTTAALVFGSHFAGAQDALFRAAERIGARITSGLVVSDRNLPEALQVDPAEARETSLELASHWHGRGRIRYAVTPRFSVSCSEAMLEACGDVFASRDDLWFTSHLNESVEEIAVVRGLFPRARDYLDTYQEVGLLSRRSVLAHNVHVTDRELPRLAATDASVAHCPSSNGFLGSGLFPLRGHLAAGVRVALGSDVGAGTSLNLLSEACQAYQTQMVQTDGQRLGPAQLLYLATRAGADALALDEVGDLRPGTAADFVLIRPQPDSTFAAVLEDQEEPDQRLGAIVTLAREQSISEVYIAGQRVYPWTEAPADPPA